MGMTREEMKPEKLVIPEDLQKMYKDCVGNFFARRCSFQPNEIAPLIERIARLTSQLAELERSEDQSITERDEAIEAADRLAYAIGTVEQIGEHSNVNNPWEKAIEYLPVRLAVARREALEEVGLVDRQEKEMR
jgi:hypothetical protein